MNVRIEEIDKLISEYTELSELELKSDCYI